MFFYNKITIYENHITIRLLATLSGKIYLEGGFFCDL